MNCFVTATDTGVGKTLLSILICRAFGKNCSYFKPVECGQDSDTELVKKNIPGEAEGLYRFKIPASPHFSAALEKKNIETRKIIFHSKAKIAETKNDGHLVIEGAGGLMVPLSATFSMLELIKKLSQPVVIVARASLGTLNHSLLSVRALKKEGLKRICLVLNEGEGEPKGELERKIHRNNLKTLREMAGVRVFYLHHGSPAGKISLPAGLKSWLMNG